MKTRLKFRFTALSSTLTVLGCFLVMTIQHAGAQNKAAINKPNVHISVKKKTDKNGNIISYDSTYISTWSSNTNNGVENDSIYGENDDKFQKNQFGNFPFNNDSTFSFNRNFYDEDSLFFRGDFKYHFPGHFDNAIKEMEDILRQHQTMIRHLFKDLPDFNNPYDSITPQHNATPKSEDYKTGPEL
jgi:hypothetical protein